MSGAALTDAPPELQRLLAALQQAIDSIAPKKLRDAVQLRQSLARALISQGDLAGAGAEAVALVSRERPERFLPSLVVNADTLKARLRCLQARDHERAQLAQQVETVARLLRDALLERARALLNKRSLYLAAEPIAAELADPGSRLEARFGVVQVDAAVGSAAAPVLAAAAGARRIQPPSIDHDPAAWAQRGDALMRPAQRASEQPGPQLLNPASDPAPAPSWAAPPARAGSPR